MNSQSTNSTESESPLLSVLLREPSETLAAAEGSVPQDDPPRPRPLCRPRNNRFPYPISLEKSSLKSASSMRSNFAAPGASRTGCRTPQLSSAVLEELRLTTRDQVRETLKSRRRRIPIPLGAFLFELGYVREIELRLAVSVKEKRPNQGIGAILVESHSLTEDELVEVLSIQLGLERLFPRTANIDPHLWQESKWLRAYQLVPIGRRDGAAIVAMADPLKRKHVDAARKVFGRDVIIGIAGTRRNPPKRSIASTRRSEVVGLCGK